GNNFRCRGSCINGAAMSSNRIKLEDFPRPQDWVGYWDVIYELGPSPFISQQEADRILRKICDSGVIQAIRFHEDGAEFIPSAEWKRADFDTELVFLNNNDVERHRMELQKKSLPEAGKQPRIKAHLAELFPKGVPNPAYCPRKALKADLLKR